MKAPFVLQSKLRNVSPFFIQVNKSSKCQNPQVIALKCFHNSLQWVVGATLAHQGYGGGGV